MSMIEGQNNKKNGEERVIYEGLLQLMIDNNMYPCNINYPVCLYALYVHISSITQELCMII